MEVKVFAKLNLTLNVFPREGQFHPLDSIVTSVNICDVVRVEQRPDKDVCVFGCDIPQKQNSAYKAACAFVERFDVLGCNVFLQKGIPVGAGMGGSSADAAAVVYCLCKLNDIDVCGLAVHSLCAALGSDINFMLRGGIARMTGKGDDLEFFALQQPLHFVLTTLNREMSTPNVYGLFDEVGSGCAFCDNAGLMALLRQGKNKQASALFCNCLQAAALWKNDYCKEYLEFCRSRGLHCSMTGSGSAFFIAAESNNQALRLAEDLLQNGFSATVCQAVDRGIE